jgi:hypothetical protein
MSGAKSDSIRLDGHRRKHGRGMRTFVGYSNGDFSGIVPAATAVSSQDASGYSPERMATMDRTP